MKLLLGIPPDPVEISAGYVGSVVPVEHPIHIDHGEYQKIDALLHLLQLPVLHQHLYHTLDHK